MREWPTLEHDDIAALTTTLASLGPAWDLDPTALAGVFGWPIDQSESGVYQLATGPGTAKGYLFAAGGRIRLLEIPITTPVPDDNAGLLGYHFARLSPIFHDTLGDSIEPQTGRSDEIVWADSRLRLTLARMATDLRLFAAPKRVEE